jgi:hypothetical protein
MATMTHREVYTDDGNSRSRITIGADETSAWFPVTMSSAITGTKVDTGNAATQTA